MKDERFYKQFKPELTPKKMLELGVLEDLILLMGA